MLEETVAIVERGAKAGKTLDELKAEKVLAEWEGYGGGFIKTDSYIETLYHDITGRKPGGAQTPLH
jgi:hypothetical protein